MNEYWRFIIQCVTNLRKQIVPDLSCFAVDYIGIGLCNPIFFRVTLVALRQPLVPIKQTRRTRGKYHDDVIKWKHFPRYWPFVRGIHRSPRNSPHKGQWRGALMISLICTQINGWVNNGEAGDLRRHLAQYDVTVMSHRSTGTGC